MTKLAYSVEEAAEALSVSERTIRALLRKTDFPSLRIGCRVVIPVEGLQTWLDIHTFDTIDIKEA